MERSAVRREKRQAHNALMVEQMMLQAEVRHAQILEERKRLSADYHHSAQMGRDGVERQGGAYLTHREHCDRSMQAFREHFQIQSHDHREQMYDEETFRLHARPRSCLESLV